MGKVRPEKVKKISRELVAQYPDKFTTNFEDNKKLVKSLIETSSPKITNRIAGYITRLVAAKQEEENEIT
ncbi:MAG: 30S ribosomal protein S17e [Candidatus Bathyarchaeota archaeon]|nr:MAG: 30S ribosomal protein S17e [Candidatus Bathyarchaeota archaeon]